MADFQDEVRHVSGEAFGTVIAVYEKNGVRYFDVRADDHIYYETPAANWITTKATDE